MTGAQPLIAVVGAGIGGLTAAIAFARNGHRVEVVERSPELRDVGAGLQLSPNATNILKELGLRDRLENRWREPRSLNLICGSTLRPLAGIAVGEAARKRWAGPYAVMHRAGLQRVLADAAGASPLCRLHLGVEIEARSEAEIIRQLSEIAGQEPDLIVMADGVWSKHRSIGSGAQPARFTGYIAWRAMADKNALPFVSENEDLNAFLGPKTHFVTYPLGASQLMNAVAITPGQLDSADWDAAGDAEVLSRHFIRWNGRVAETLAGLEWRYWPLFESPKDQWRCGQRIALIGDAAHAMTPFAAQGAAMAIEDAFELATQYRRLSGDATETIAAYERLRLPRLARVRRRGAFNRFAYHAVGPVRLGRDLVLRSRSAESLATDFDWLYGYQAGQ